MSIAENLKKLRARSKMSQVEVCTRAHISQSTYSAYESGASAPKIKVLSRLADVFGVSVAVIDPSLLNIGGSPPTDAAFAVVVECWSRMSAADRVRLSALALELAEKNTGMPQSADGTNN